MNYSFFVTKICIMIYKIRVTEDNDIYIYIYISFKLNNILYRLGSLKYNKLILTCIIQQLYIKISVIYIRMN